ncbi:MAG: tetratricopeptide repeat protein, partial [Anaerolineae bacterium]
RLTLWQLALRAFQEDPLTGVGFSNYGRSLLWRNDASLPRRQIITAHNLYLNTAAEAGLVGLMASGWLLGSIVFAFRQRWQEVCETHKRMHIGAAGAALAGFAAQNLVDTFTATPVVLPALVLMASALTLSVPGHAQKSSRTYVSLLLPKPLNLSRLVNLTALGVLVLYLFSLLWWDGAQYHLQRSIHLAQGGHWEDAIGAAARARQMDPGMALYAFQLAHVLSMAGAQTDTSDARLLTSQASTLYRTALLAEPVHGRQSANLAATLWRLGDREGALVAMQEAVAADPAPILVINLGYLYQQLGDVSRAMASYARALASAPELAASQFWEADAVRQAHWPEMVRQAEQVLPAHFPRPYWRLRLMLARQEWSAVQEYATALWDDPSASCLARSTLARAQLADGQLQDALEVAEQAIRADAACGAAYLVRGQVRLEQEEENAAEQDWRIALFLGQSRAAYHLGQLYESRGDLHTAARFYRYALPITTLPTDVEVVLYERRVAFDLLPPLFHIGIGPEEAAPYLALGSLYQAQGNYAAARQLYQMLLIQDPYLLEAQKRLEALEGIQ